MKIESSAALVQLMKKLLPKKHTTSGLWVIGLDADHEINLIERTRYTSEEFNSMHIRRVYELMEPYRIAFCKGSKSVFLFHSCPPKFVKPTKEDFSFTKRQMDAGRVFGLYIVDHIIVAGNEYYSMADNGTLGLSDDLYKIV